MFPLCPGLDFAESRAKQNTSHKDVVLLGRVTSEMVEGPVVELPVAVVSVGSPACHETEGLCIRGRELSINVCHQRSQQCFVRC